ncbi:MAG TPA: hypothetical protein ENN65_01200 [Candidatus Hydrogenedentes bacterium]|nr:hypothetical protein [Candidatus Hydrogenedentota bacterium]
MAFQSVVMLSLLSVAGCALIAFLLLVFLYHRNEKRQKELLKQTRLDIADMAILFQTMRDIIGQQKALARQFNQAIDQKTAGVKTVLAQSIAKNERLYEQQQALLGQIQEAQAQLQSLQRQMAYLDETVARLKQSAPGGSVQEEIAPPPPRENAPETEPEPPASSASSESRSPAQEEDMSLARARNAVLEATLDEWRDLELDAASPKTEEEAPPEAVPEQIDHPQAARDAFRALLDMEMSPASPHPGTHPPEPLETAEASPDGNGGKTMVALQKRILEYSEAGMSIADISRELGIGKGEIRLMLSLAKQRRA